MPTKIFIGGHLEADRALAKHPGKITLLTLRGSRDPGPKNRKLAYHETEVVMDDITEPLEGYIHPELHHAQRIIEAWEKATQNNQRVFFITCGAGISRSTGAGLALLFFQHQKGQQPNKVVADAAAELMNIRPHCTPNKKVLELVLKTRLRSSQAHETANTLLQEVTRLQKNNELGSHVSNVI